MTWVTPSALVAEAANHDGVRGVWLSAFESQSFPLRVFNSASRLIQLMHCVSLRQLTSASKTSHSEWLERTSKWLRQVAENHQTSGSLAPLYVNTASNHDTC